jgi:Protein of unknown function (DUF2924)
MAHLRKSIPTTEIERHVLEQIKGLGSADFPYLKRKWIEIKNQPPPPFAKRIFLTRVIAWELQAKAFGGTKPALHRLLLELGRGRQDLGLVKPQAQKLSPGIKLMRLWRGESHQVIVTDAGFLWRGKTFKSLSVIAREITGTRWSGPVFFGLKKSKLNCDVGP